MPSRLRSRLASSEEDRVFQRHLADAERALKMAGDVCQGVVRQARNDRVSRGRAQETLQTITKTIQLINTVGHLTPIAEGEDIDLTRSEARTAQRREEIRQKMEQDRQARRDAERRRAERQTRRAQREAEG